MGRLLFLYNPHSGKAQIKNSLSEILDIFVKAGYEVTVRPTQARHDAYNTVKSDASRYDLIVCSGGDGTLNESVSGLLSSGAHARLGYIPAGTTNDFASSLGIPKNMSEAARAIVTGKEFLCDIGSFNDAYFTYISAFGAFTEVSYQTPQPVKNMLGHLAYVLEGIKHLGSIKTYRMTVEHDGEIIEDEFVFGMVSNSMSVGGFKSTGEAGILLDDGLFEVALVKMPKNPIDLQQTINDLLKLQVDSDYIYFFKTSAIHIRSAEEIAWTLDGEYGGLMREVYIRNNVRALPIMIAGKDEQSLLPELIG